MTELKYNIEFQKGAFAYELKFQRVMTHKKSMQQVADETGLSKATISRIELEKDIDLQTFTKICNWLKMSPASFFSNPEVKN